MNDWRDVYAVALAKPIDPEIELEYVVNRAMSRMTLDLGRHLLDYPEDDPGCSRCDGSLLEAGGFRAEQSTFDEFHELGIAAVCRRCTERERSERQGTR